MIIIALNNGALLIHDSPLLLAKSNVAFKYLSIFDVE